MPLQDASRITVGWGKPEAHDRRLESLYSSRDGTFFGFVAQAAPPRGFENDGTHARPCHPEPVLWAKDLGSSQECEPMRTAGILRPDKVRRASG